MFTPVPEGSALAGMADVHLRCLATPDTPQRAEARRLVRAALRETLAELLSVAPERLPLLSVPGQPLRLGAPWENIGLSVSHEPGLSLFAINLAGPLGVDLLRVAALPADLAPLARDYLGPAAAEQLAALAPAARRQAFAVAWTQFEASLKCLGLALGEWTPQRAAHLATCRVTQLTMPAGWVAALALPGT
jgi:4'-phosphopantetheinyl transferase